MRNPYVLIAFCFLVPFLGRAAEGKCVAPPGDTSIAMADEHGHVNAPIKGGGVADMTGAPPCGRIFNPLDFLTEVPCQHAVGYYTVRTARWCENEAANEGQRFERLPGGMCRHRVMRCLDAGWKAPQGKEFGLSHSERARAKRILSRRASQQ